MVMFHQQLDSNGDVPQRLGYEWDMNVTPASPEQLFPYWILLFMRAHMKELDLREFE